MKVTPFTYNTENSLAALLPWCKRLTPLALNPPCQSSQFVIEFHKNESYTQSASPTWQIPVRRFSTPESWTSSHLFGNHVQLEPLCKPSKCFSTCQVGTERRHHRNTWHYVSAFMLKARGRDVNLLKTKSRTELHEAWKQWGKHEKPV